MDEIKLIQTLIQQTNELPDLDNEKLDALERRARMITKTLFGAGSDYGVDLSRIHFVPMFAPATRSQEDQAWKSGKAEMLNLLNTMLEELEISAPADLLPELPEVQKQKKVKGRKFKRSILSSRA